MQLALAQKSAMGAGGYADKRKLVTAVFEAAIKQFDETSDTIEGSAPPAHVMACETTSSFRTDDSLARDNLERCQDSHHLTCLARRTPSRSRARGHIYRDG